MKKSNKLLVSICLMALVLLLAVHLALYANLKSGNYTLYKENLNKQMITHALPRITHVSLSHVHEIIVYESDTSRLQYNNKEDEAAYAFKIKNDTLMLSARDTTGKGNNWSAIVRLGVPGNAAINALHSIVVLRGSGRNEASSFSVYLDDGTLKLDGKMGGSFKTLSIAATNNAEVHLHKAGIGKLDVSLKNAYLADEGASIDSINLHTDAASKIALTGRNFLKIKTTDAYE